MEKKKRKQNRFRSEMTKEQTDALRGTEIRSKRTRNGKVFALGGNRFQAVTYTDPVHRYNEKTHEWEEIDNRFKATTRMKAAKEAWKQGLMPAVERGEALLECKTGNVDVSCGMAGEVPFITLTDPHGRTLSWGIEDAMSILPEAEENHEEVAQNVRQLREKTLNRLHGEVVYGGIFSGVDLRCKLDRGFKDELIFAAEECVRPVTFLLQSEGRQMELDEQNRLIVRNSNGDAVFSLAAPFLEDVEQKIGAVTVQLTARGEGVYAMTYTPDEEFMAAAVYPVVLDPAVEVSSSEGGIVDTSVSEKLGSYSSLNRLMIRNSSSNYGVCNAYIRVTELPKLGSNHYITSAHIHVRNYSELDAETTMVMSEVLEDWDPATINYANQPAHSAMYQDCCTFPKKNTAAPYKNFVWREMDVTSLARKWYLGENHGVVFTPAPTPNNTLTLHSSEGSYKPYLVVNYASLAGLENYLSYDVQPAGLAGKGYVSLTNGNLIFAHNDTSMNGNRMPVSVTHYYNSCDANRNEFGMGYGWRTSLHQTIHKEYINDEVMYVYTDGDGTEHWFELDEDADTVQYADLSGLSLTLTVAEDGIITIKSKSDSRMVFPAITVEPNADNPATEKKLIASIHDAVGNQITITPVDGATLRILSVTDGADRVTTFTYADGLCDSIRTPWQEDEYTRFSYSNGQMTYITHEDGRTAAYAYEVRNGYALLTNTSSVDGVAVAYTYSNTGAIDGLPFCIQRAVVTGTLNDVTLTASDISYSYGNHMALCTDNLSGTLQTQVRSVDVTEQRAPKSIRRHFNDNGNEISIDDELGFARYTRYDQTGANENAPVNHATTRSSMQRAVKNLLADSMFELNSSVWEKSSGNTSRVSSPRKWGSYSYKLTASTAGTYVRQVATLEAGKSYTFSGYLLSGEAETFLRISYTMNGVTYCVDSDPVTAYTSPTGQPFERESVSFTLPAGADAQVYCAVMCVGSSGEAWASCMQLEEGLTCNHFNLLQDQDYTVLSADNTALDCWRVGQYNLSSYLSTKALTECAVNPPAILTGRALHLEAHYNPEYSLSIEQVIQMSGNEGDRFTVGGWCSTFARRQNTEEDVYCCLDVCFRKDNYWFSGGQAIFNYEEGNWQFACAGVTAPNDYTQVMIRVNMSKQMNSADVTGLFLYPEAFGTDCTYDAQGNPVSSVAASGAMQNATFDDFGNLISYTAPGRTLGMTASYGETEEAQRRHLLQEATSPMGTVSCFTYDDYGNATQSDVRSNDESDPTFSRGSVTYTDDGNYSVTQTDARGKTVTTVTDPDKGTTSSVTDPKGNTVTYQHDALRRVTSVNFEENDENLNDEAGIRSYRNEYTYSSTTGQLTSVRHNTDANRENDVEYSFTYDALGRKVRVLVGDVTLFENEYQNDPTKANYSTLTRMRYGNGMTVQNQYDDFNRLTGVIYGEENEPSYSFEYNAQGHVAYIRNRLLSCVTESEYDTAGRPCRVKMHADDGSHIYTSEVAYDDIHGNLVELKEKVGEVHTPYSTNYGYDEENRPTSLSYGDYGETAVTYDKLGRVCQRNVKAGNGVTNTTTYAFEAGGHGDNSTTGLVKSITQAGGNFTYTYDDNGNIVGVLRDGVATTYTYDALAQLIRVVDGQEGATWEYSYDQGGNILSKKKYVNGIETESMEFGYTNENWRDQLTKVNDKSITYDQIGNPLSDGIWTYTWQNGRQLQKMQRSGETVEFVYNENGLRVQKTATTTGVTKYILHGKKVVHMTQGSDEMHFFYDAQNKPDVVVYNGTAYSYVKNLQGDVVALLDSTGTVVVSYVYDVWGRPLSKIGSMAATLGTVQPFRYRSYVYDEETGLYYLQSRYFDSNMCRFVNADVLYEYNLYSYCQGNPVAFCDNNGYALVCCFDENGRLVPIIDALTGGGGGVTGGGRTLGAYLTLPPKKILPYVYDPIVTAGTTYVGLQMMNGASWLGQAFLTEAVDQGFGCAIGGALKYITIAIGGVVSTAVTESMKSGILNSEPDVDHPVEFLIDVLVETVSPYKGLTDEEIFKEIVLDIFDIDLDHFEVPELPW